MASGTAQGTLPWSWYIDPDLLRHEQERIFRRGWQYAGPAESGGGLGHDLAVETWGPLLFVNPDPDAPPLAATLGPLPELLASGGIDLDRLRFRQDVSDAEVEKLLAFDNHVGLADRALVESVQGGVRSGLMDEGRLMPESERLLAHFQQLVREALA